MSIRFYKGYWTVFSGEQPVVSCPEFPMWLVDQTEVAV